MSPTQAKRRWTDDTVTHIGNLPSGILVGISAYLSKPSRALLAVAFTAPSLLHCQDDNLMHRPSPISKTIIAAQQWETLDFMDIEKSLANVLSDDDMYAMMQCINAHDVLKKLKLTGCVNITGEGLRPLMESVVLEQIDLSLLKQCENLISSEIRHSMNKDEQGFCSLPILDSIISSDDCSLKHILLPYSWKEEDPNASLHQFANRYNQSFENSGVCSKCALVIQGYQWFLAHTTYHYNTCYKCLKHICNGCSLNSCHKCKKDFCKDCDSTKEGHTWLPEDNLGYGDDSSESESE